MEALRNLRTGGMDVKTALENQRVPESFVGVHFVWS